ncbi:MAG: bifunctional [glutamine synthetase] adenylyltransferase/[glutamine synthetase]-adenylyl-L-tyrosine phosphorylase, partial [Acetobacteraceae bacterium]
LLALFARNPALIARLADVLGAAPGLSSYLARNPAAIEGLLLGAERHAAPARALARILADAPDLERAIALVRGFVHDEEFRISAAALAGLRDADAAGRERSMVADAALAALLGPVTRDHAARYGTVPGGGMAVVLLGKAGGREMMAGSDLDLMLVYDHPEAAGESRGGRALPASQYFLRLAHGFVAALTAPGAEGAAYAVDMRLRPSGNKGPVAVSLAAFRRYHAESAWTWERMALTRARVVAGPARLAARVGAAIGEAIRAAGPAERVRADAAAMRARLAREQPAAGPWDVKHRAGGLVEVEFIAQTLQLVHAARHPEVLSPNTAEALGRLAAAGLMAPEAAAALARAGLLWRSILGQLRLRLGGAMSGEPPEALAAALAETAGVVDAAALRATMEETAARVREAFLHLVGPLGNERGMGDESRGR